MHTSCRSSFFTLGCSSQLNTRPRSLLETLGGDCGTHPPPNPFVFLPGDITIDGETISNVGIRKKGFFGSLDRQKPSLEIDFTEFVSDQRFKDPFLVRNFGNATGNLYEGAVSDFRDHFIDTFEPKNSGDLSDLRAFRQAMEAPDAELLASLQPFFDLDTFVTYWAMEGLVGHWDSYSGNSNNFWIYNDPATGFQFVPWSLDDIFGRGNPFGDVGQDLAISPSAFDRSTLVNRLWGLPQIRTAYHIRIQELLDDVSDEGALLAEIDRMQALIEPIAGDLSADLDETRQWISDRATHVADDFGSSPPAQLGTPLAGRFCLEAAGTFHADFTGQWDTLDAVNPINEGTVDFTAVTIPPLVPNAVGVVTGIDGASGTFFPTLRFVSVIFSPLTVNAFNIEVPPEQFVVGGPVALDDSIANQILFIADPLGAAIPFPIGAQADITMTLTDASMTPGGAVAGVLDGTLAFFVPAPEPTPGLLSACALSVLAGIARTQRARRRRES